MTKITKMPSLKMINGLKGKLDFYYWMGIAVCRSWPRSPGHTRSPDVMAQWPAFTYATQAWKELDISVKQSYMDMALETNFTGRDLFMRSYLKGLFNHPPVV